MKQNEWKELTGHSNFWKPTNKGDEVSGVLISKEENIYTIEREGEKINLPNHTWLMSRLEEADVGDELRVVFTGMEKTNTGREAFAYSVFARKPSQ